MPRGNVRVCRLCGESKLLETEFYFRKERGGYYRTECKDCIRVKQRAYNAARAWPDRSEYQRAWRAEHAESERLRHRRQYRKDPARRIAATKRWVERNRENVRRTLREQQQKRRGAPMDAEAREWWEIVRGDVCSYCGGRTRQSLDHIDALARGADSHWMNLAPACCGCNSAKQDRTLLEFLLHRTEVV